MKTITIFHLKIIIFTAVKNRSILHGRVFVMERDCSMRESKPKTVFLRGGGPNMQLSVHHSYFTGSAYSLAQGHNEMCTGRGSNQGLRHSATLTSSAVYNRHI